MAETGIIKGSNGYFNPTANVTRAQAALMIERTIDYYHLHNYNGGTVPLKDLPTNKEYSKMLQNLFDRHLLLPTKKKAEPNKALTRGEMARIIEAYFKLSSTKKAPLTDVTDLYTLAVDALYEAGITTGSNGKFNENEPVSRQHFALFLSRAISYYNAIPVRDHLTVDDSYIEANKTLAYLRYFEPAPFAETLSQSQWGNLKFRQLIAQTIPELVQMYPNLRLKAVNGTVHLGDKNWTPTKTKALGEQFQISFPVDYTTNHFFIIYFDPYVENSMEIAKKIISDLLPDTYDAQPILDEFEQN